MFSSKDFNIVFEDDLKDPYEYLFAVTDETTKYNYTMAMFMASRGFIPPKEWHHNPKLRSKANLTVAHLLAVHKITPPKEWIF